MIWKRILEEQDMEIITCYEVISFISRFWDHVIISPFIKCQIKKYSQFQQMIFSDVFMFHLVKIAKVSINGLKNIKIYLSSQNQYIIETGDE